MSAHYRNINCMIVPTGIGASIGGYAADANPACKLLAKASDLLITHPNVVNGAMLTDIPHNVAVVEGYLLDRFFAEQVALRLNVKHRIAVVIDAAANEQERILTENAINAARTVYGLDLMDEVFYTNKPIEANDLVNIKNYETLLEACQRAVDKGATAFAILAVLNEDSNASEVQDYVKAQGLDPIGLIEAKLSHLVSSIFLKPSAHAPIIRKLTQSQSQSQTVSPKVAAEYLSDCFLISVLKCLQHSPQIIPLDAAYKILSNGYTNAADLGLKRKPGDIMVSDLANVVIPYDSCNNTPAIEAHKYGIQVLCVKNNTTKLDEPATMFNIPHRVVHNYLEAAGYFLANTKDKYFIKPDLVA